MATDLYREIKINRLKLEKRKPWPVGVKEQLYDWQREQFVYSSMHLDGYLLSREAIRAIGEGEVVREASFADYALVQGLSHALDYIGEIRASSLTIVDKIPRLPELCRMWGMLNGKNDEECRKAWEEKSFFRSTNPVLHACDHVPCHFRDVPKRLDDFFAWLVDTAQDVAVSPVDLAAEAHNRWIYLYPFESCNEALARLLSEAILAANGLPYIPWSMEETVYNGALLEYVERMEKKEADMENNSLALILEKLTAKTQKVAMQMLQREE